MRLKFKIIESNRNEFLGWFGEDLIKVRVKKEEQNNLEQSFLEFLESELGIKPSTIEVISSKNNFIEIEFPDIAWELFLTVVK